MKWQSASVMDYLRELDDPRIERSKRHQLLDIVAIAICAVLCGADSWLYVEMFGKSKEEEELFRSFLDLPNGIPSHDTFCDVFPHLAVKEKQGDLNQEMRDLFEAGSRTGLDGLPHNYATTLNKRHGRIDRRECWAIDDPACPKVGIQGKRLQAGWRENYLLKVLLA